MSSSAAEVHSGNGQESRAIRACEVLIIGAGIAGVHQLYTLSTAGFDVRLVEAGAGAGGVWFWNRYPMARFDSESYAYGYLFDEKLFREWEWKERFAGQPEIEAYINHVVDRYSMRERIEFGFRVTSAVWDEAGYHWTVTSGDGRRWRSRHLVAATGLLSVPFYPETPGRETFAGQSYHTGRWPAEPVDFSGRRVAVIGTGSSGVQIIPPIAAEAAELTVYQRTANWCTPLNNSPILADEWQSLRESFPAMFAYLRESASGFLHRPSGKMTFEVPPQERRRLYEQLWNAPGFAKVLSNFGDLSQDPAANEEFCEFLRGKIRETVHDPDVADALIPKDHGYGQKRPPFVKEYYEVFNKPNVSLVDLRVDPIREITARGIVTAGGERALEIIVWATGFDAGTGALLRINPIGMAGRALREHWADGPQTYLGVACSGFPNFYFVGGPHGGGLGNLPRATEIQVDFVTHILRHAREHGYTRLEAEPDAEQVWTDSVYEGAQQLNLAASSWFLGSNVPGKPKRFLLYPRGQHDYRREIAELTSDDLDGFAKTAGAGPAAGRAAEQDARQT
jgi:cation diffusion facilitator CzcD-associated flavoprotein CzcO